MVPLCASPHTTTPKPWQSGIEQCGRIRLRSFFAPTALSKGNQAYPLALLNSNGILRKIKRPMLQFRSFRKLQKLPRIEAKSTTGCSMSHENRHLRALKRARRDQQQHGASQSSDAKRIGPSKMPDAETAQLNIFLTEFEFDLQLISIF